MLERHLCPVSWNAEAGCCVGRCCVRVSILLYRGCICRAGDCMQVHQLASRPLGTNGGVQVQQLMALPVAGVAAGPLPLPRQACLPSKNKTRVLTNALAKM